MSKRHNIKSLLKRKRLSQSQLARAAGVSAATVSRAASGKRNLSAKTASRIATITTTVPVADSGGGFTFQER